MLMNDEWKSVGVQANKSNTEINDDDDGTLIWLRTVRSLLLCVFCFNQMLETGKAVKFANCVISLILPSMSGMLVLLICLLFHHHVFHVFLFFALLQFLFVSSFQPS